MTKFTVELSDEEKKKFEETFSGKELTEVKEEKPDEESKPEGQ